MLSQVKDANRVSGQGRSTCPWYDELDAILGTRAASSPPVVLESSTTSSADASVTSGTSMLHVYSIQENLKKYILPYI